MKQKVLLANQLKHNEKLNLKMNQQGSKTEVLSISIIKICETRIQKTLTKPQETLDFKMIKSKDTFSFKPTFNLGLDSNWRVALASLEVFDSFFNRTEEINKIEH